MVFLNRTIGNDKKPPSMSDPITKVIGPGHSNKSPKVYYVLVLLLKTKKFLASDGCDRVLALLGIVNHKVATHQDEYLEGLPDG